MNNPEMSMDDPQYLTVEEYAERTGKKETTVRTMINRQKLNVVRINKDGQARVHIVIPAGEELVNDSLDDSNDNLFIQNSFENNPESFKSESVNNAVGTSELLNFMSETFDRLQNYSSVNSELSRENEKFKLLSDGRQTELDGLKKQVFDLTNDKNGLIAEVEYQKKKIQDLEDQLAKGKKGFFSWPK